MYSCAFGSVPDLIAAIQESGSSSKASQGSPPVPAKATCPAAAGTSSPGIISVIAGLVMLVWPIDSIAVLTLAAGIWLIIIGITQIIQAFQTRKAANTTHQTLDAAARHMAAP